MTTEHWWNVNDRT